MPRYKEEWLEVNEAAAVLSAHSNGPVSPDYVRLLAYKGKIRRKQKDRRTNLYLKHDLENYHVKKMKTTDVNVDEGEKP